MSLPNNQFWSTKARLTYQQKHKTHVWCPSVSITWDEKSAKPSFRIWTFYSLMAWFTGLKSLRVWLNSHLCSNVSIDSNRCAQGVGWGGGWSSGHIPPPKKNTTMGNEEITSTTTIITIYTMIHFLVEHVPRYPKIKVRKSWCQ